MLYPNHFEALEQADLLKDFKIPTLGEQISSNNNKTTLEMEKQKKKQQRERRRKILFVIGFSKFWSKPLPKLIQEVLSQFPKLSWLRFSMAYKRFSNLSQLFQSDMTNKMNTNIISKDFETLPCNCRKINGTTKCNANSQCRTPIVVYQAKCLTTGKKYIGNTSCLLKTRFNKHWFDTRTDFNTGKKSTTLSSHLSSLIPETHKKPISASICKEIAPIEVSILWKGNPMNTVKTFGSLSCALCNAEKCHIIKALNNNKRDIILNQQSEIFGACKHIPKIHRLINEQNLKQNLGTDEPPKGQKKTGRSRTTRKQTKTKETLQENFTPNHRKENIVGYMALQDPFTSPLPTNKIDLNSYTCPSSDLNIKSDTFESTKRKRKTKKEQRFSQAFFPDLDEIHHHLSKTRNKVSQKIMFDQDQDQNLVRKRGEPQSQISDEPSPKRRRRRTRERN
jgi:hypothetical protein